MHQTTFLVEDSSRVRRGMIMFEQVATNINAAPLSAAERQMVYREFKSRLKLAIDPGGHRGTADVVRFSPRPQSYETLQARQG